ncbi:MAG: hypothetical protein F4X03_08065 [Dehalococcoidia bacterium]|nr:hypothetical protein [Dehalococcoidia bacterium]
MRRLALLCALAAVLAVPALAAAQDPEATVSHSFASIGEPITVTITLDAPADAVVEVDPAGESWGDVRVIRVLSQSATATEAGLQHRIEVLVAPFAPGAVTFSPAVVVTTDSGSVPAPLPSLTLEVPSTLSPDEPLALSPLPPPVPIDGAQSAVLWPGIALGGLVAVVIAAIAAVLARRWWRNRPVDAGEVAPEPPPGPDILASAEALLETDAAGAYRAISSAVRHVLGERYEFPAQSLTAAELETRMADAGVDGWEERMARELLRECDAVVYAGYRPVVERRVADLRIAREIIGGTG